MTRSVAKAAPPNRKALSRELLIELLAYQFAFPVRWIETQDEILTATNAQRIIEIGPGKVLAPMAQKTWAKKFAKKDAWTSNSRTFLSHSDDMARIYYEYEEAPAATPEEAAPAAPTATPVTPAPAAAVQTPQQQQQQPSAAVAPPTAGEPATQVPDAPLQAVDVVVAIAAHKLKREFDQLPLDKTIRTLCAGKSTLQNEIIGDLTAEFTTLPSDEPEDATLAALGTALDANFANQPGKVMSAIVARLVSRKMPAGFNQAAIRAHLETNWGLGPQRQLAVLCFAVTVEPAERLAGAEAARGWVDGVAGRYGKHAGVALTPGGGGARGRGGGSSSPPTVDAASLKAVTARGDAFLKKQHELLRRHLGVDAASASARKVEELEEANAALAARLERWNEELGEDFFAGVKPAFDARKARVYESAWNWVRVDLLRTLHAGGEALDPASLMAFANRWDDGCEAILQHFSPLQPAIAAQLSQHLAATHVGAGDSQPRWRHLAAPVAPKTTISPVGVISYAEVPRETESYPKLLARGAVDPSSGARIPYVHLRKREGDIWRYDTESTETLLGVIEQAATAIAPGLTFAGKTALVTGAGPGSIGANVVQGLLSGGARVFVTTSRAPAATAAFYNDMFRKHGAAGSKLVVLPFNQASAGDCEALVAHIHSSAQDNSVDLDFIVPFAAVSETGREMDGIDAKSEVAHRLMLTNLLRLLGHVKKQKERRGLGTKPTTVVLPLSPNHGTFGGDGLYAESKIGLETLFNRSASEGWAAYLSVVGAVIGWTRGTGLMGGNNIVAAAVEERGAVTFSQGEMALNLLALMAAPVAELADDGPVYADLNGGVQFVEDLKGVLAAARERVVGESRRRKACAAERALQEQMLLPPPSQPRLLSAGPARANITFDWPALPASHRDATAGAPDLRGMIDLSSTIVVVGFSELGPWGSARTRWEMERDGELSVAGHVELAWMTGLIKHDPARAGWVDAKSNASVADADVARLYGEKMLAHAGIRPVEGGDDGKETLHELVVGEDDMPAFEASRDVAGALRLRHGADKVDIVESSADDDVVQVRLKQGSRFLVPKSTAASHPQVAGQLPAGWDPRRYGIPDDIVTQTDPMTLYVLCCVNEALLSAGFRDPFEIWRHIHVSELANCVGTGAGGLVAMRKVYRERYLDGCDVQNDILQESFPNAMDAWANMLLLASAGPIKTPSGTCATAVESLDTACDAIRSGAVKMAIVGGADDLQHEMSTEFANMKATANPADEAARGRLPREMSRPTASSRAGFVEAAGCGVQVLMTAEMALRVGAPIHAVVAHSQMAGDRVGRSVPAPGKGILTAARQDKHAATSPLLDLDCRRRQLREEFASIEQWRRRQTELASSNDHGNIAAAAAAKTRAAQHTWSHALRTSLAPGLSPITAALATWGLRPDDIAFASFHGTSTAANDKNESHVVNAQMAHLGRNPANPLLVLCQKHLTGHPKGAAGAWMLNGALQALTAGVVPGNRNADDVDAALRGFEHLVFPARAVEARREAIKAFMLTSFGFGQKGGLVVGVAPRYLFAAVEERVYERYCEKVEERRQRADARLNEGFMDGDLFRAKERSPWKPEDEADVFLDPHARSSPPADGGGGGETRIVPTRRHGGGGGGGNGPSSSSTTSPVPKPPAAVEDTRHPVDLPEVSQRWIEETLARQAPLSSDTTIGIDVESISSIDPSNDVFLTRNFTDAERAYCDAAGDPHASLAGRWAAKEAVFKSLRTASKGAGAAMGEIEILSEGGKPVVKLHGEAEKVARARGVGSVQVSITHAAGLAMAVAVAGAAGGERETGGSGRC